MTKDAKNKILVIDDDRGPRESLRILLKNEFEVFCAASVAQGLELLREHGADLVVSDIRMPDIDGIEGLRRIREADATVPVIMLTGYGSLETAREALRHGANDYLKKPFETAEFLELVREHLGRGELRRRRARSEAELHELNSRLREDLARKDHMASLGQASAELVHDLRNPMTVVYGYLQLLARELEKPADTAAESSSNTLEYVKIIEQSVKRCNDLIEVWRLLGRKHPERVSPFAMSELLPETAGSMREIANARNAVIALSPPEGSDTAHCRVLGDRTQLSRVFHNLISNAIDAVPDDGTGRVEVAWGMQGDEVAVSVADNGCGMPPEILGRIMDAYYSTKPAGRGTGLGLFIAGKIVDDHHGRLTIDSTVGTGSRFTVFLPGRDMLARAPSR